MSLTVPVLFLLKKDGWAVIGIIAAIIFQILVVSAWNNARFGTIGNVGVFLVAIPTLANVQFYKMVDKEVTSLFSQQLRKNSTIVTREMLDNLPPIVQQWLIRSGVVGKQTIQFTRLKQKGAMRTKPGGNWMPFTATQYVAIDPPGFNWKAAVKMMPLISMNGRDKFENGKGELLIKVLSLVKVARAGDGEKLNTSTMIRFLGETTWFPTAALSNYIKWESIVLLLQGQR